MTAVNLPLLHQELTTAGVIVPGLGTLDNTKETVHTYDAAGQIVSLPPAADPVVAAHTAPPLAIEYAGTLVVDAVTRTTDAALTEVFRLPTTPRRLYRGTFQMMAIDAVSGAAKDVEARLVFRQQAGSAVQVGATVVLATIQDSAASNWAIQGSASGGEFVIGVRGAAGRTIDWLLRGSIATFAPDGL
jgi:hypothetical protein